MERTHDLDELLRGLRAGDRTTLARAITLVESTRADDRAPARKLLREASSSGGRAVRIGITGIPGVGKSTLIDALGLQLIERGHKVAVLAIDPSSTRSGGSILGDKTRMERLAADLGDLRLAGLHRHGMRPRQQPGGQGDGRHDGRGQPAQQRPSPAAGLADDAVHAVGGLVQV